MELGSVLDGRLHFLTNNTQRITILGLQTNSAYNNAGYTGFNLNNPQYQPSQILNHSYDKKK